MLEIFAALCAILFAIPAYFILSMFYEDALLLSIISGLLFYFFLHPVLYISGKRRSKRYAEAEKIITSPIWYRLNSNITTPKGVLNANTYFTDGGIVIISMDKRPYILEQILLPQNEKFQTDNMSKLNIFTNDDRLFVITSSEIRTLYPLLKDHDWI